MAITTKELTVTPAKATEWLEGNVHNRNVRDSVVSRYARDMKAGAWRLTHQGIAFDRPEERSDKVLVDGQHRLFAIIESDTPVRLMVSFGVPMDAQGVIDDNLQRTMVDTLKLAHDRHDVTNMHVAIVKRLLGQAKHGRLSRQEIVEGLTLHQKAVDFAITAFSRKVRGITTAPVLTVVTRAYYTVNRDQLARFAEALLGGVIDEKNGEQPILMLRNWLLEKAPIRGGSTTQTEAIYGKTARALSAYLDGERITTLYSANKELFPMPSESAKRVKRPTQARR